MGLNILITGAAGYIGGSVLSDFISRTSGPLKTSNIFGAVRSKDQVEKLEKLGVNAILLDLVDQEKVLEAVISNQIDLVVHTAGVVDSNPVLYLIQGLGERRKATGKEVYFIHSSVATLYSEEGGWPSGEVKDTDNIFEKEKEIGGPNHARLTSILATEQAEASGVKLFNLAVPTVYGRGSGEGRKLSVSIPANVRASMKNKVVYKFDKNGATPAVHISDLAEFYTLLTEKILLGEPVPSGRDGYYFAFNHRAPWWDIMQRLAEALHARGLVTEPVPQVWPSDGMASEELGFPRVYLRAMGTASGQQVPVKAYELGWQPKWTRERFLDSMDDEVRDVLELDTVKATLFGELLDSASK